MDQQRSETEEETNHAVASGAPLIAKCAFNNPSLLYFCNFSWYLSSFISRDKSCILCFSSHNFQSYLIAQKKNQGNLNIMDKQIITETRSWGHLMIVKCLFSISPCVNPSPEIPWPWVIPEVWQAYSREIRTCPGPSLTPCLSQYSMIHTTSIIDIH